MLVYAYNLHLKAYEDLCVSPPAFLGMSVNKKGLSQVYSLSSPGIYHVKTDSSPSVPRLSVPFWSISMV